MKNQKSVGILLSYLNTALNMCFNLLMIPMLIGALSDTQYGIYKVMQSYAGPLMMLNLGMSTIVARSIARYRAMADEVGRRDKENTFAMATAVSVVMALLALAGGLAMTGLLPRLFADTYTAAEVKLAKEVMMVFVCTNALHIVSDTFRGCILGRERFAFYYGTTTVQYVLRFAVILLMMRFTNLSAVAVAMVDLVLYGGLLLVNLLYSLVFLKERMRFYGVKRTELISIASFSLAVLLQAVITQVNNNLDNVILGAMVVDKRVITMYSSALSIFNIYNVMLSVLANVYFPKIAQMVARDSSAEELTDCIIGPGRVQAVISVAVLCAFGLFGGNFIKIWIGPRYLEAWPVAMILMIPTTIPLVQNLCLAVLNAKLKQLFRSVTLFGMAVCNVIVSVLLVPVMGFWGAAAGTAICMLLGHGLLMNLYYAKVLKLNVVRMFREIFAGILPAGLLSVLICLPLALFLQDTFWLFAVKCAAFVAVFGLLVWKMGLKPEEKQFVRQGIGAVCRKK